MNYELRICIIVYTLFCVSKDRLEKPMKCNFLFLVLKYQTENAVHIVNTGGHGLNSLNQMLIAHGGFIVAY